MEVLTQRSLWDTQHATRGAILECGSLRFQPNDTAVLFDQQLPRNARILEVGSANGRDARYWAALGHTVIAADFSFTALSQLQTIGHEQGVMGNIYPVVWDINVGSLPINPTSRIDAFYARSALHVDDVTMMQVAVHINDVLCPEGIVLIEGKGPNDKKITRSHKLGTGLAIDPHEQGHLRRIWTTQFTELMCQTLNWDIMDLTDVHEEWQGVSATFMRLIARKG